MLSPEDRASEIRRLVSLADDSVQLQAVRITRAFKALETPPKWDLAEVEACLDLSKQMVRFEKELV